MFFLGGLIASVQSLALQPIDYRVGMRADVPGILATMVRQAMNPLGINHDRFIVAEASGATVGFAQIRPCGEDWELSSVYVEPEFRGRGIGSELVKRLLANHAEQGRPLCDIYLLTLASRCGWYEALGWKQTLTMPDSMELEFVVGTPLARLVADDSLVSMRHAGG